MLGLTATIIDNKITLDAIAMDGDPLKDIFTPEKIKEFEQQGIKVAMHYYH